MDISGNVAVCLVGSGSHGIFTSGAIKRLNELKIQPKILCACSSGSLNACMWAQDQLDELENLWLTISNKAVKRLRLLNIPTSKASIYDFEPLHKLLNKIVKPDLLNKAPFPTMVSITDAPTCSLLRYMLNQTSNENTLLAPLVKPVKGLTSTQTKTNDAFILTPVDILMASVSVPGFVPLYQGRFADGGCGDDYNILAAAQTGVDTVIAIHPNIPGFTPYKNIVNPIEFALTMLQWSIYQREKDAVLAMTGVNLIEIMPSAHSSYSLLDFDYKGLDRKALIQEGYDACVKVLG